MEKLSISLKSFYGLGFLAKGVKDGMFQVFLFFFYNQVLGLDPFVTGIALTVALIFDSITDPLVGVWSDQYQSNKWGRRHPFMFASAIPLGVFLYLLFLPPDSLGQTGLFLWLVCFAVLVRLSLTLFMVPAMSLGAEMSTNYEERTSITSFRVNFATVASPIVIFIGFTTFFAATEEYSNGMFRASSYPKFALFCACIATLSILLSTYFTKNIIPSISKISSKTTLTLKASLSAFREAYSIRSFRLLITYILVLYVAIGIGIIFSPYYVTYFFTLSEKEFATILLSPAPAGIFAFILSPFLNKFWDKKYILISSTILTGFFFSSPYNLRFLGLFPENNTELLFPAFFVLTTLGYMFLWISVSISHSMMADTVDEYELQYGSRNEGIFFASLTLAYKATTGLGSFFAGLILKLINFPENPDSQNGVVEVVDGIGYVGGPVILSIYILSTISILFYSLTKERYLNIREQIENR